MEEKWIPVKDKKKAEDGKKYFVTVDAFGKPRVMIARCDGKYWRKLDSFGDEETLRFKVIAWWPEALPDEPAPFELPKPVGKEYVPYEVGENGVNSLILVHLKPEAEMRAIGFTDYREGYWFYHKMLDRKMEISFNLSVIKEDSSDFRLDVLDVWFFQPFDYQGMLSEDAGNKQAKKIDQEVEKVMAYLAEAGIISGHVAGEYI